MIFFRHSIIFGSHTLHSPDLLTYYSRRAQEYEQIYLKPERQEDLVRLKALVAAAVAGRDVLEVACGTGYWTQCFAASAHTTLATDASAEVLALARAKLYPNATVDFALADAFDLGASDAVARAKPFSAAVAAFWYSHVPKAERRLFFEALHACLAPAAVVWLCDNRYVAGSSTPISHTDAGGNTYQQRSLRDGSVHMVMKNFPAPAELRAEVSVYGGAVEGVVLDYYWAVRYVLPEAPFIDLGASHG